MSSGRATPLQRNRICQDQCGPKVQPAQAQSNAANTGGPEADVKLKEASDALARLVRS